MDISKNKKNANQSRIPLIIVFIKLILLHKNLVMWHFK